MFDVLNNTEYAEQPKLSKIWDAVISYFFDGYSNDIGLAEANEIDEMMNYFLTIPRYKEILEEFMNEEVKSSTYINKSNYTEVCN